MNVEAIESSLKGFLAHNRFTFDKIAKRQSALLELAAIVGVR